MKHPTLLLDLPPGSFQEVYLVLPNSYALVWPCRFNRRYNAGLRPVRTRPPAWCSSGSKAWEDEEPASPAGQTEPSTPTSHDPKPQHAECCCMFRTLSLMELQTFKKLCSGCSCIQLTMEDLESRLTPQRIEAAFLVASSINGLNGRDRSVSDHNKPGLDKPMKAWPNPARMTPTNNNIGPRPTSAYGTPFTLGSTRSASAQRLLKVLTQPQASSSSGPGSPRPTTSPACSPRTIHRHRPAVPTLNFLQFIEALRLVAVNIVAVTREDTFYVHASRPAFSPRKSCRTLPGHTIKCDHYGPWRPHYQEMREEARWGNHVRVHCSAPTCCDEWVTWRTVFAQILESLPEEVEDDRFAGQQLRIPGEQVED